MLLGLMLMNRTIIVSKIKKDSFTFQKKKIPKPLPPFSCNFVVGVFCGLVCLGFFHFYTEVTALTLAGCEVYSSTNNREKNQSLSADTSIAQAEMCDQEQVLRQRTP